MSLASDLAVTGNRWLQSLEPEISRADPECLISPRSRILCAGLGTLSSSAALALGASPETAEEAGLAGAALSLLTKLDDEVIDSFAFHGGPRTARCEVSERTRSFLAPTLDALLRGANGSPLGAPKAEALHRSRYAHFVGSRLARLASSRARLDHVLASIELGWDVQVRAACVLTAAPRSVDSTEVLTATRSISGAWLGMITLVGELARGSVRAITENEVAAIWEWGSFIQRADSLCDLEKDQKDGLVSTFVAHEAYRIERLAGARTRDSARLDPTSPELHSLYALVAREGIDLTCIPTEKDRRTLAHALSSLGHVEPLLSWIFGMLFQRYIDHPLSVRERLPDSAHHELVVSGSMGEVQSCLAR
jgi:hypothetical protein